MTEKKIAEARIELLNEYEARRMDVNFFRSVQRRIKERVSDPKMAFSRLDTHTPPKGYLVQRDLDQNLHNIYSGSLTRD